MQHPPGDDSTFHSANWPMQPLPPELRIPEWRHMPPQQPTAYGQHWQQPPYAPPSQQAYPVQPYQPYAPQPPMYQQINVQPPRSNPWKWAIIGIVCFILLVGMLCCAFTFGGVIGESGSHKATPTPTNYVPAIAWTIPGR
jgi:hypothetical protein